MTTILHPGNAVRGDAAYPSSKNRSPSRQVYVFVAKPTNITHTSGLREPTGGAELALHELAASNRSGCCRIINPGPRNTISQPSDTARLLNRRNVFPKRDFRQTYSLAFGIRSQWHVLCDPYTWTEPSHRPDLGSFQGASQRSAFERYETKRLSLFFTFRPGRAERKGLDGL